MIKPNELRIGNWVHLYNKINGEHYYAEVTGFTNTGKVWFVDQPESEKCAWGFDKINPIPLTEEWLLKFGWVWNTETDSFENRDVRMSLQYRSVSGSYTMFNGVLKAIIAERIKYVHQLQNLYFALTGEELQIKIK